MAVLALVLTSCQEPGATTNTGTSSTGTSTTTTTSKPTTTTPSGSDTPQYGGTATYIVASDVIGFDEAYVAPWFAWTTHLTEDEMLTGDWAKGQAGTGQYTWTLDGIYNWDSKAGQVCESWEVLAPNHWVFKVRQGIKFGVNPNIEATKLTNGREITAEDVVYSYDRLRNEPASYVNTAHNALMKAMKLTVVDKYTVDLEVPNDGDSIYNIAQIIVDWTGVVAKEVVQKYGNMKDWKVAHGTGPYFLTDYVPASSLSFEKNPRYWDKDPVGPGKGNQLPYLDGVRFLIIGDTSTQLAALRTAKVDQLVNVQVDDADSVKKTSPQIDFLDYYPGGVYQIHMRTDKADLPYSNKKVRQALMKATDYDTIVRDMMKGRAKYPTFPITPMADLNDVYLPIGEASAAAQDLYKYDPEAAKALLKEAGYPNGFKANIISSNIPNWNIDYLSVIKQMWSKVGVDLNIVTVEQGIYSTRWAQRNYDELFFSNMGSSGTYRYMVSSQGSGGGYNLSYISDPRLVDGKKRMLDLFAQGKDDEVAKVHKELSNYIYEDAWVVNTPVEFRTNFWWPWLKNYHGETAVGILNPWGWNRWVWVDKDLKKEMGK